MANLENGRQRILVHQLFALVNTLKLESVLDLVPRTWASGEPLPAIDVSDSTLSRKQQSAVQGLLESAFAGSDLKRRSR